MTTKKEKIENFIKRKNQKKIASFLKNKYSKSKDNNQQNCPFLLENKPATTLQYLKPCNLWSLSLVENRAAGGAGRADAKSGARAVTIVPPSAPRPLPKMTIASGGTFAVLAGERSDSSVTTLKLDVAGTGYCSTASHPAIQLNDAAGKRTIGTTTSFSVWQDDTGKTWLKKQKWPGYAAAYTDAGVLLDAIWSFFSHRHDIPFTVDSCGVPQGTQSSVPSLSGIIAVYPDDEFSLKVSTPPFRKGEGEGKWGSRIRDEEKGWSVEKEPDKEWKVELKHKNQDITNAADFAKYFRIAADVEKRLRKFGDFLENFRPGVGFYLKGGGSFLAGELSAAWRYDEPADSPFVLLHIEAAAKLTLLAIEVELGGGGNFMGLCQADLFIKVEGEVGVEAKTSLDLVRPEGAGQAPSQPKGEKPISGVGEVKISGGLKGQAVIIKLECALVATLKTTYSLGFSPLALKIGEGVMENLRAVGEIQGIFFSQGFDSELIGNKKLFDPFSFP